MSGSTSREVRQRQYEKAQGAAREREEKLTAADIDASLMGKDPVLRKLKAELKQARGRLNAIDTVQEQVRKAAEEKKAKPKEAKPKGDKKAKGTAQQPAAEKNPQGGKKDKNK